MIIAPQYRSYDGTTYCYCFGYSEANDDGTSGTYPEDNRLPYTTAILHGNYDYASDSTKWDPTISDHALPASYYLPGKPAWWPAGIPWPPIGPDLNPMVNKIPAQVRYENSLIATYPESKSTAQRHLLSLSAATWSVLEYQITQSGLVKLEIFDVSGRLIETVVNGYIAAGVHRIGFDAKKHASPAVLVCRLTEGESMLTKKVMRVR